MTEATTQGAAHSAAKRRIVMVVGATLVMAAAAFGLGRATAPTVTIAGIGLEHIADIRPALDQQEKALEQARRELAAEQTAIARRIGEMQAQVLRLNAAGQRLTEVAALDADEFDFSAAPPVGGPADPGEELFQPSETALKDLDVQLELRHRQLDILEHLLLVSQLHSDRYPSGWPVKKGWISSAFGRRSDPFTGRVSNHRGLDFAAQQGSEILAVAGGVVSFAGQRSGYGNVVEINHGNGYVTRYGHNKTNLVRLGDRVVRDQPIALVGQSGRATGPHVHFEVLVDGVQVNPHQFVERTLP